MSRDLPEIQVTSSADGLGVVLRISNPAPIPITVFEPHPHTSVQLYDSRGQPWPMHNGVFAAIPRWKVTVPPGEVRQRIVTLPRFFLDAQGAFEAECMIQCRVGEQVERLTARGCVRLSAAAFGVLSAMLFVQDWNSYLRRGSSKNR